ncbi:MAG: redox-regulated ATPase YchF [Parcubacteria group bacterium]|nr:redox-regulated ATPase YchF [Parcubacteria group bacterium]
MSFSIGIVGLPNVGKSTLFKALTRIQVEAANYPFCTIDPNVGVVKVPDERLDQLSKVCPSELVLPTTIEFVDIAGLVKGAAQGEGLGNKFLSNIRDCSAIAQVVRVFESGDIIHVAGKVDPQSDVSTINLELILADLAAVDKRLDTAKRTLKSGASKDNEKVIAALTKVHAALNANQLASTVELTDDEQPIIKEMRLLTSKPMLYVLNVSEEQLSKPLERPTWMDTSAPVVRICAQVEGELADLPPEEAQGMLEGLGLKESGLAQLIKASYQLLNLQTFFTVGPKEAKAWTIKRATKAPQAAGVIHTDFEKGFIRAEVINWQDFVALKGEAGCRDQGKLRTEGKEYVMADGDVCHFLFN